MSMIGRKVNIRLKGSISDIAVTILDTFNALTTDSHDKNHVVTRYVTVADNGQVYFILPQVIVKILN